MKIFPKMTLLSWRQWNC